MTLVYRSVFSDVDGRICQQVDQLFEAWLASKGLEVPDEGLTAEGVALVSGADDIAWAQRREILTASTEVIRRLRLVEEAASARWVTTIVWATSSSQGQTAGHRGKAASWVWVDLEHEPVGDQSVQRPGSPRVVRELLAAGEAQDGILPLTSEPWLITGAHVGELVRYVTEPTRQVPVIVFAYDGQRAYDQARLAKFLARDLAGVAVVFRLEDGAATERFAAAIPDGYAVYGGAMRTFLPGAMGEDDLATRHRVLGRASLVALGPRAFPAVKDQILALSTERRAPLSSRPRRPQRQRVTPVEPVATRLAESAALTTAWVRARLDRLLAKVGLPPFVDESASPEALGEAFDHAIDHLDRRSASPENTDAREAQAAASAARQQADLLDQLLEDADKETKQLDEQLAGSRAELEDLQWEATEAAEVADRSQRRTRWLERRLRELGDQAVGEDDGLPEAPPSVAETLALAREHLTGLELCDTDESAAALDLHAGAQLFAIKVWTALAALNAYALASAEGRFSGSFYAWCQTPPDGEPAVSATAVAMTESEPVQQNPAWREARVFKVHCQVSSKEQLYMPAHIKISRWSPAPRLHFHDATSQKGKVIVGYIGEHLPTARFH